MDTGMYEEYKALFNNAAIGIIIVDRQGNIFLINDFALQQFGYTEAELTGRKVEMLIPPRFKGKHENHRDRYMEHDLHSRPMGLGRDLYARKKDGTEFPVEVSLSTYRTEKGVFSIAFISDISVRKESEQALVQLNAELEEKVRERTRSLADALKREMELNELKSRFVSMASHEFRTPLSTILSSLYLIGKYDTTDDQARREKHIRRSISSVNLLTDILNDFLSVGRIEEGKIQVRPAELNLLTYMDEVTGELNDLLKNGQSLTYEHTGDPVVVLDPALLKHILINLVSNAIKFSPDGGLIRIATANDAGGLTLAVQDTGLGIPEEDQQHLFERFFRGTNVTAIQGTGLGLHIVSKYVELMNGTITCDSRPGVGTTFTIRFKH